MRTRKQPANPKPVVTAKAAQLPPAADHPAAVPQLPLIADDQTQQIKRLTTLEDQMEKGIRSFVEALQVIVTEKLYRVMGHDSLEEYMQVRWARTRKWVYDQLRWLSAVQFLESKHVTNPLQHLSVDAAQVFRQWQHRPEIFYLAFQRVVESGAEPAKDRLAQEAEVQQAYLHEADSIPELTFSEYQAYQRLTALPCDFSLEGATPDELVGKCRERVKKPYLSKLTAVARGDELVKVVDALEPLCAEVARIKNLQTKKDNLERQKREQTKVLTEQVREVTAELDKLTGDTESGQERNDGDGAKQADDTGQTIAIHSPPSAPSDIVALIRDLDTAISDLRAKSDEELTEVVKGLDGNLVDDLADSVYWLRREKRAKG